MGRKKAQTRHAEIVQRFAAKLREARRSRGMTQAELGRRANISESYIRRLESAGAAPGIDMVERLAVALGTTVAELLPATPLPDDVGVFQDQARKLFESVVRTTDRATLSLLVQFLSRISETTPL